MYACPPFAPWAYVGEVARAPRRPPALFHIVYKNTTFLRYSPEKTHFFLLVSYFYLTFAPANKQTLAG